MSFHVAGIGEVLWDLLPSGRQLGGAPANFAFHAHALGAQARIIARVGADALGREIIARVREHGLDPQTLQVDESFPTGTVTVALDPAGNPQYTIHENVAWDQLAAADAALDAARSADAVCFGSLAQRSPTARSTIQRLVSETPPGALRIFDINLRQQYYSREVIENSLRQANLLKLNGGELPILTQMFGLNPDPRPAMEQLAAAFQLRLVALTLGAEGSLLYQEGRWSAQKPSVTRVVDTVGAGDSFTAALVWGLLHRLDLDEIHAFASRVASYVCSCAGATPPLPKALVERFGPTGPGSPSHLTVTGLGTKPLLPDDRLG